MAGQGLQCACLPHGGILSGVETIEKDAVGVQGAMLLQPRVKHARGVAQQDDQFDGAVRYLCGPREAEVQDWGLKGDLGPALGQLCGQWLQDGVIGGRLPDVVGADRMGFGGDEAQVPGRPGVIVRGGGCWVRAVCQPAGPGGQEIQAQSEAGFEDGPAAGRQPGPGQAAAAQKDVLRLGAGTAERVVAVTIQGAEGLAVLPGDEGRAGGQGGCIGGSIGGGLSGRHGRYSRKAGS